MVEYNEIKQLSGTGLPPTAAQTTRSAKDTSGNFYVSYVHNPAIVDYGVSIIKLGPDLSDTVVGGPDYVLDVSGSGPAYIPAAMLIDNVYIYIILVGVSSGIKIYVRRLNGTNVVGADLYHVYAVNSPPARGSPTGLTGAVLYNNYIYANTSFATGTNSLIAVDLSNVGTINALTSSEKLNPTDATVQPYFLQLVDNLIITCDYLTGPTNIAIYFYDPSDIGQTSWTLLSVTGMPTIYLVNSMIVDNAVIVEYNDGSLFRYYNIFISTANRNLYKIPLNGPLQITGETIATTIGTCNLIATVSRTLNNLVIPSRYNTVMYTILKSSSPNPIIKIGAVTNFDPHPCFLEGTEILTDKGYIPIQDLRAGDKVKTLNNGFVPIFAIGKRGMVHPATQKRIKGQLYVCSPSNYPELTKDLVLTGCHSILIPNFVSEEQALLSKEVLGGYYFTDGHLRLPTCVDSRATVYPTAGFYPIYHFALEHEDRYVNYGVYANGLLVETTSKRYMLELSGMTLLE